MKLIKFLFTLQIILIIFSCRGQIKPIELKSVKFESIFGYELKDNKQVYCLLGTGFFKGPTSKNADSLIVTWISNHPNAKLIQVSTLNNPKDKLTYCWLVDKSDTINNYLIKNGCFPGGTMMRPQTYFEMSDEMKALYNDTEKPKIKVHIEKNVYDTFIKQIKVAETYAEVNKLGIWNKKGEEY